jgi:Fe-S oxidoreductase
MSKSLNDIVPAGHLYVRENILKKNNLTGIAENKAAWAKGLQLPKTAEYLFFAGCGYQHMKYVVAMMGALKSAEKMGMSMEKVMGINKAFSKIGVDLSSMTAKITASKEDPYTRVLTSAVSVLRKIGIDVGYLHEEEPCCGSPLYYTGFADDYGAHARENYSLLKSRGVKKIVGLIPACTSALKKVYPTYINGYDLEVYHFFEIAAKKLKETDRKLKVKEAVAIAYHEPCQLSRYLDIRDEPREILQRIEGVTLVELDPEQSGKYSTCCGGGGLEAVSPELSERIGVKRVKELGKTGASLIVTNCPACEMQLNSILHKQGSAIKVMDLVTLIDEALEEK